MILFYTFVSIVTGYTFVESPILGLFFYAILMYSTYLKSYTVYLHLTLTIIAAVTTLIVYSFSNGEIYDELSVITVEDYKYYPDSLHYIVEAEGHTYELYNENQEVSLEIGNVCMGNMEITTPEEERNFIKRDGLKSLQINELAGRIYMADVNELTCHAEDLTVRQLFNNIRYTYMKKVLNMTDYNYKYDILTLSVGNKNYITSDFFESLQKLGIYHLYVISGTHVAFLSAFLYAILKRLRLSISTIKIIIIISLLLFLLLNFFSPSVMRAVFMGVLLLVSSFFQKKPYLAIISLSALVQVLFNPYVVYHAGFQLSYITTYFILLSRPLFMHLSNTLQLIMVTIISELSTLVIVLIHFNEISISGLLLNIVFVPVFSFIIFPSVIIFNLLIFLHFPPIIDNIYNYLYSTFKWFIYFIADAFKHRIPIKNLNVVNAIVLLHLTYLLAVNVLIFNGKKLIIFTSCFILVLIINHQNFKADFTLTMVDVGQGDAFIIQDHRAYKTVLIDTGGVFQMNENSIKLSDKTLLPYLKEQGVDFIDLIILSHLDLDHTGELFNVLDSIEVGNVIMNTEDEKFNEWVGALDAEYYSLIIDSNQLEQFSAGNILFEHFITSHASFNSNEQSLVLKVHLNNYSILFTGDIGLETEEKIIDQYNLKSDILKVSHHGSDSSTGQAFINNVNPTLALISSGVNNRYNHPHETVLNTLSEQIIINTQQKGMVEFSINHDTICIRAKLETGNLQCLKKGIKKSRNPAQ